MGLKTLPHLFSTFFNVLQPLQKIVTKLSCPFLLNPIVCSIYLICELLWRGEVMQGVRRRERVVMVEICIMVVKEVVEEAMEMVEEVVPVEPARSGLEGQVRG